MKPRGKRVAVIGGGWAGLSAAVEATRLGHTVTLFEMAPQLGGRARSVSVDTHVLDNGQHIMIGAYRATLDLMRKVGVDVDRVLDRRPLALVDARGVGLRLPSGPAMPAFVRGVFGHTDWTFAAKCRLLLTATGWMLRRFRCDARTTVADLTASLPASVRQGLIEPLCVAALNTPAAQASGMVFLRVLKDALFAGRGSADLLLPRAGLSELLPDAASAWLAREGTEIRLGQRVDTLTAEPSGWSVDQESFEGVILATSAVEASRLTRDVNADWSGLAGALRYEPIVTVYLQTADQPLPEPMLSLPSDNDAPAQFVFDRGLLGGARGLQAYVISGAAPWVARGMEATVAAVREQARSTFGGGAERYAELRTFTEKRATFRCTPALRRPAARVAAGLFAAADYVDGPYPATLEGAVLSGRAAAMSMADG